jgi:hypothetical protein
MRWRLSAEQYEELSPDRQAFYKSDADGGYMVDVEPDSANLKSAHDRQKAEKVEIKKQLDAENATNAESRARLEQLQRQNDEREERIKAAAADFQAVFDADRIEFEKQLEPKTKKLAEVKAGLSEVVITHAIHRAAKAARGVPELLEPHLRKRMRVDFDDAGDHQIVVLDSDGNVMLDERGQPIPLDRLVEEIKLFVPALARAFDPGDDGSNRNGS